MSLPAPDRTMTWGDPESGRRIIVGIGEMAVADRPDDVIVTYALGSCVAVCLFDPAARVAAMLHFLLPESSINSRRAIEQPAAFGDTGIPLLLDAAGRRGLKKSRTTVRLVGGAMVANNSGGALATGHRNVLAARSILWRMGLFIEGQEVGGVAARTVHFAAKDGRLLVLSGQQTKEM
jgi:chemotaxis protein CheD